MAQDRNGNNHKAAGRPDGGRFDRKAGQGSDDDLEFGGYVAGMDAPADRTAIKERPETLSADDWRVLRRSASWGVRMLAWSSPKSPTPTDDEFDELLYDESQRVRGAAAYRDDLTEAQVEALLHDGLMYRYNSEDDFGMPASAFTICTFWLIRALFVIGEREEARRLFDGVLRCANHVGLFSEDIDFDTKELLGNFPQAYSHLALVNTAVLFAEEDRSLTFVRP